MFAVVAHMDTYGTQDWQFNGASSSEGPIYTCAQSLDRAFKACGASHVLLPTLIIVQFIDFIHVSSIISLDFREIQ